MDNLANTSNLIDLNQLSEVEIKLTNIKKLLSEVLELYAKLQAIDHTRIQLSIKKVEGDGRPSSIPLPTIPAQPSIIQSEMTKDLWNDQKEKFLKDNYPQMSAVEIAEMLNVPPNIVYVQINRLGLDKKINLTSEQIQYLKNNFGKALSPAVIARELGIKTNEVYAIAKQLKLSQDLPPDVDRITGQPSGNLSDEDLEIIRIRYVEEHKSVSEIAREFKVAGPTIRYHIKKHGWSVLNPCA